MSLGGLGFGVPSSWLLEISQFVISTEPWRTPLLGFAGGPRLEMLMPPP